MGDRGFNAGGFAYMNWRVCQCGRKFIMGWRSEEKQCPPCRRGEDGTPKRLRQNTTATASEEGRGDAAF